MPEDQAKQKSASEKRNGAMSLIWGTIFLLFGIRGAFHASHISRIVFGLRVFEVICGFLLLLLGFFAIFGMKFVFGTFWVTSFGRVGHEKVIDRNIEQRVRERYTEEIRQLTFLGFNYSFLESESFSIFRLFMIVPAIVLLMMLLKREVLAIGSSATILVVVPVFCSVDERTFAQPCALGVKFYTAFRNGRLLITKNFKDDCCETPEFVVQAAKRTISETWQAHQACLDKLDTDANPANRDRSYEAFVLISERESELLKSQIRSLA